MHNSIEDFQISTDSQSKLPPNGVPIVAVRPLLSEHHAKHLPPKYITLHWNIGKRCNYDCSYCSPHIHDAVSPHLKLEQAKIFLDRLDNFALERDRILDFFITGGEPFVNPDIIEFFKAINNLKTTSHRLCVTSNGSLPLKMYLQAMDYLTNLTFSVHLERSDKEINSVIKSIVTLGKRFRHEKMISVNLMCLPGRFDKIKQIIDILSREKIYYVLRRIRPSFDEDTRRIYQPHEKKRIKKWGIVPVDEQKKPKKFTNLYIMNTCRISMSTITVKRKLHGYKIITQKFGGKISASGMPMVGTRNPTVMIWSQEISRALKIGSVGPVSIILW